MLSSPEKHLIQVSLRKMVEIILVSKNLPSLIICPSIEDTSRAKTIERVTERGALRAALLKKSAIF